MLSIVWMLACDSITVEEKKQESDTEIDADGDGYFSGEDCNDTDSSIYPGADETTGDGKDSNCDGDDDT